MPEQALIELTKEQLLERVASEEMTITELYQITEQHCTDEDRTLCCNAIDALRDLGEW